MADDARTIRQRYLKRLAALKAERASWDDHWRDVADHTHPRRVRFFQSERNKGWKKNDKIINSTPTRAVRILASGMMAGVTSPARPWFRLTTPDPELAEFGPVRRWLHIVEERQRLLFARSNLYNGLHNVYVDLAGIGTSALHLDEDPEDLLRAYSYPVGQYVLATSDRLQVDTVYRELSMTVAQMVKRFGLEACSPNVQEQYRRGELDSWVDVIHVIEPRADREPGKVDSRNLPWKSCWFEAKADEQTGFLRESGYREFPVLAPRWDVTGEDVYGRSPGMDALGDCKALQLLERRKASLVDKTATPPMQGPASLLHRRVSLLPGDFTPVDHTAGGAKLEPALVIHPAALGAVREMIQDHEERINAAFYADLWLMMIDTDRRQVTAREVAERHEEKMLQLGPVLERLQDELLDPLIDRAFSILLRSGGLPPPPEELQGQDLRVEYISILAQAQKLVGTSAIDRLADRTLAIAAARPDVLDKVNWDEVVDAYGDALGVPPDLFHPDEAVQRIRQERAAQQQAQRAGEAALAAAQGAQTLANTPMEGDSALNRLLAAYGSAPPAAAVGGGQ